MSLFAFTEEQESIREMVRTFAEQVLRPNAAKIDKTREFPREGITGLAEMGILSLNIPEEYGGAGLDDLCRVLAIEEAARCCAGTADTLCTQLGVNDLLVRKANEEQKRKYLPLSAQGKVGSFGLTEPGAGSDAGGLRTRAIKEGDSYILNGSKCFITNMGPEEGEYVVVFTLTDPEKKQRGGMTAFIVDRGTPGFTVGKREELMGNCCAGVSELSFADCRVPASAMLGEEGDGFKIAMSCLDGGRIGVAALALGIGQSALEEALKYTQERVQFGKPLCKNQGIQWYIAEMSTRLEAARLLTYRAADTRIFNKPGLSKQASMAKFYASEASDFCADLALQLHGGYGYTKEYPIERIFRDSRLNRIGEGSSEIQKTVIAKEMYKEYAL